MFKKRELLSFFQDRPVVLLFVALLISMLFLVIMTALSTHASDVLVTVRFTRYGTASIYQDKWYMLLAFGIFGVILFAINGYAAIKIHAVRRGLSLGLLSASLFIMIVGIVVAGAVFRLAHLSP